MTSVLEILFLRRPVLEYIAPPICEVIFSGSGFPIIILEPLHHLFAPTGLRLSGEGNFVLSWDNYPGALCYTVYKAADILDPFGAYSIIAECIQPNSIDLSGFGDDYYRVSAITLDGESDLSAPFLIKHPAPPIETCDQTGIAIPTDFTLTPPTSLGTFSVAPNGTPVLVATNAPVGSAPYQAVYQGGTIKGTATAPTCFNLFTFPHGFEVDFAGGSNSISDTPPHLPGQDCGISQAVIEALVPIGKVYGFSPSSVGNISLRWSLDGTQYVCGDSCPKWEIIAPRILIPQPKNLRIHNFSTILANFICAGCCANVPQHPNFPAVTEWDGRFGGIVPPNSPAGEGDSETQFNVNNHTFYAISDNIALLGRFLDTVIVTAPETGAHINGQLFNAGFGFGSLPPLKNFWFFRIEATATIPGHPNVIWWGVKEYGNTALGHYYRIASCDSNAPNCVTLEEDI